MPQEMTFGESLITALDEIMGQDRRVVLIGGGLVGTGSGQAQLARLREKYSSRIKNPPIAELGFCGIAAGAAMAGLRPLVDIGTATFSYEAIPQIVNEAAIAYSNSGGQTNVPVVYFMRYGIRGGGGVQHSGSPQPWYWNTPGLQLAMPASPADAKGLLRTALMRSQNPTIFLAHERLMNDRGPVPDGDYEIPFGQAAVKREGRDVTIIATGIQVPRALAAAEVLGKERISAEVVDPRTLQPLDKASLLASVKKTGRLVVTDESHDNCGVAAGLAAIVADEAFTSLRAPIKRVAIPHVPIPFAVPLENFVTPTTERIVEAVRTLLRPA
ncbi:MAG: alpha-ketoacid dehydrogenase subunit beta [Deltaproteobacteria bacterium]|nr:MAG: alpha-ketoacid dehydrogenase subunit beta [Deltaproteobacteria bacterium]